jgi:hypothetical protein
MSFPPAEVKPLPLQTSPEGSNFQQSDVILLSPCDVGLLVNFPLAYRDTMPISPRPGGPRTPAIHSSFGYPT